MSALATNLPRGPVTLTGKTDRRDYESGEAGYTRRMLGWRESAREEAFAIARLNPEYEAAQSYQSALMGEWWDRNRPRYRSNFYDNRLADARIHSRSVLTDIRPFIDVNTTVKDFEGQSEIIVKCIKSEWYRGQFNKHLIDVVDHALFGVGYWKIGALTPGRMTVTPCGMDCVLPIQPGLNIQESTGVLYRTFKALQYFYRNFGEKARGLENQAAITPWIMANAEYTRPDHLAEYTWNSLSPAMRQHLGMKQPLRNPNEGNPFPVVELEEYWIEDPSINETRQPVQVRNPMLPLEAHNYHYMAPPGERLFPRKRLIVFAGDRVMYDGPSPYWHGLFPFAQLALDPCVWAPGGISLYRNLMPINKATNEVVAGILDVIKKAIRPVVVTKEGAIREAAWDKFFPDLPGGKLRLTPIADVTRDFKFMNPPILPGYVYQAVSGYLIPTFDRRAGMMDMNRLTGKKQIPGGETIEQMRDAQQPQFRLQSEFVESFLVQVGEQAVSNIIQYWTADQRMKYFGADGVTMHDFDFRAGSLVPFSTAPWEHHKNFSFQVLPGSLHGASHERMKTIALTLAKMGKLSTRALLRRLEWPDDPDLIMKELQEEHQMGIGASSPGRSPRSSQQKKSGGL